MDLGEMELAGSRVQGRTCKLQREAGACSSLWTPCPLFFLPEVIPAILGLGEREVPMWLPKSTCESR